MKFYAKTYFENNQKKGETLQEHTELVLAAIDQFKEFFTREIDQINGNDPSFWDDLKIACLLHDLGKISTPFQNKIRASLSLESLPEKYQYTEIPHNYISPSFITGLEEFDEVRENTLILSIAFHHDRLIEFSKNELENCLIQDVATFKEEIVPWVKSHCSVYDSYQPNAFYHSMLNQYLDGNNDKINEIKKSKRYILLKGLLHRMDYAASAHLPVETSRLGDTTEPLVKYLGKGNDLRPFQKEAKNHRKKNIIATASTGIGKTEFALNWLGDAKGFYTLPLRVSSNAMHKRLTKIFDKEKVGLLHSDSFAYGMENDEVQSIENSIHKINISRQFSLPLTVSTADQLFTSVFKWPGYERIYATLAYSKIIMDEPQGYSPKTLAMIIKSLEEVTDLGGKFCYMSATNHPFIVDKLKDKATILPPEFNKEEKHKIELSSASIDQLHEKMVSAFNEGKKVLVISNTVKKSQYLFNELSRKCKKVNLLHSGFIKSDRDRKEIDIQNDYEKDEPVIWVSTQIVEASLDIDYDILFTEAASLDSLVQRMGRIYRKSGRYIKQSDSPNIIIATKTPSDNYKIYDQVITERTIDFLSRKNMEILIEREKQELMNQVYDEKEIRETKFYKDFKDAYKLLEYGFEADTRREAQRLFREISQVNGIPDSVYNREAEKIEDLIKKLKSKGSPLKERLQANYKLSQFTLSIPAWRKSGSAELYKDKFRSIFLIPGKYDDQVGLRLDEVDYIW